MPAEKHEVFWQMAHSLAAVAAPMPMGSQMGTLLGQLWRAPCCNKTKEPFWRLTVNALPTAQRRAAYGETCPAARPIRVVATTGGTVLSPRLLFVRCSDS